MLVRDWVVMRVDLQGDRHASKPGFAIRGGGLHTAMHIPPQKKKKKKKKKRWNKGREMARWVEHLLLKREDWSSDPRHPH